MDWIWPSVLHIYSWCFELIDWFGRECSVVTAFLFGGHVSRERGSSNGAYWKHPFMISVILIHTFDIMWNIRIKSRQYLCPTLRR